MKINKGKFKTHQFMSSLVATITWGEMIEMFERLLVSDYNNLRLQKPTFLNEIKLKEICGLL